MIVTIVITFAFDSSIGLAIGLGTSVLVYCVFDIILSETHTPRLFTKTTDDDIEVVRIESDVNFLTAAMIKDFLVGLTQERVAPPPNTNVQESIRYEIASVFDKVLKPNLLEGVEKMPKAIVIDMCIVKTLDISGLEALESAIHEVRVRKVLVAFINANPFVQKILDNYGIRNDASTPEVNFESLEECYRLDLWGLNVSHADTSGLTFKQIHQRHVGDSVARHDYVDAGSTSSDEKNDIEMVRTTSETRVV